jgi:hypothetical protein
VLISRKSLKDIHKIKESMVLQSMTRSIANVAHDEDEDDVNVDIKMSCFQINPKVMRASLSSAGSNRYTAQNLVDISMIRAPSQQSDLSSTESNLGNSLSSSQYSMTQMAKEYNKSLDETPAKPPEAKNEQQPKRKSTPREPTRPKTPPPIFDNLSLLGTRSTDHKNIRPTTGAEHKIRENKTTNPLSFSKILDSGQKETSIRVSVDLSKLKDPKRKDSTINADSDMMSRLEEKQRENNMLRMQLAEQERRIEREKQMLKERLEKERLQIEQKAIKEFIRSNRGVSRATTRGHDAEKSPRDDPRESPKEISKESPLERVSPRVSPRISPREPEPGEDQTEDGDQTRKQKEHEDRQRKLELVKRNSTSKLQTTAPLVSTAPPQPSFNAIEQNKQRVKKFSRGNKQQIENALTYVCLAGRVNEKEKRKVIDALRNSPSDQFVVLLRDDKSPVFVGLYALDSNTNSTDKTPVRSASKVIGNGPQQVTKEMCTFFRYDSSAKKFVPMQLSEFAFTTDGVVLTHQAKKTAKKNSVNQVKNK